MSAAVEFLLSFTRTLATMSLYGEAHPRRQGAVEQSFERLTTLLAENPRPQFSFLMDEVVYGKRAMRELQEWEWSRRLGDAGLQRLEIESGITLEEYAGFLEQAADVLAGVASRSTSLRPELRTHIRYGAVGLQGDVRELAEQKPLATATLSYTLDEEAEAVRWIHQEMGEAGTLALLEAEAVVRSLSVAMHGSNRVVIPLLRLKEFDQYTTTHSINVGVLTMALAETLGLGPRDVRAFGTAGLLHDIGKVRVPRDILIKPGKLSVDERAVLDRHPVDGARIILESDEQLGVASAVAYEHHIMIDGGGYPVMRYRRDCHFASRLVHVCDVFDALCTDRPYRAAWEIDRALAYIGERAGTEFDPVIARGFETMMRRFELQVGAPPAGDAAPALATS
ncbi:MAG TPA: HD domain-containing phosphohydrolase [Gemmatimonadaceae bacterium]|nr:HD domain-containing phosphohydrolase [Gemmatimonadaceae bacterium]